MGVLTAENQSNLIGGWTPRLEYSVVWQIIMTDVMDRLVVNIRQGILDTCPNQRLCGEIIRHLAPI